MVHHLIEEQKIKFALTGSSARKLKRGAANFDLDSFLSWGGLPALFASDCKASEDKNRFLKSYIHTYLKEEILIEQLVRRIDPFHAFLQVSAQMNGEILNFSKIAREANTDDKSVERYYSILEDTLLGFHLMPHHHSVRKQQIASSKFYYFDTGIVRALKGNAGQMMAASTYEYGKAFEHFIITEIYKLNKYHERDCKLSFLKTKDGVEIDLIIGVSARKKYCIEIKSGNVKNLSDFNAQYKLALDIGARELIVISQNKKALRDGRVHVMPWQEGIKEIFGGGFDSSDNQ